ncbi:MAG TPA: DegT/DnrJ/EryC1/StrS family aminotransferase [Chloroflexota bacterium]|nr:DegT/DnrJ/EryC1/StrS family aminotransferase [Chloroflexota bacterium]
MTQLHPGRSRADRPLQFAPPEIDDSDIEAVVATLRSGWITTGPRAKEFEHAIADACGRRFAIAVNSATAALHLALEAIGVQAGDEVIVPTTTFTSTAAVIRWLGATPVLVDVEPDTMCIDPAGVRVAITARTRAVMPVHFGGHAVDMDGLQGVVAATGIDIIADAAHGFSGRYHGSPVGQFGRTAALSFYVTKTITTGEGGMLLTDDDEIENRARVMCLHGMSRDAWKRYAGTGSWQYDVVAPGFKYNMTDLAAALGLSQLAKAERMLERRREIARRYTENFREMPELQVPVTRSGVDHSWHLYVLRLNLDRLGIDRDQFIRELASNGIAASVHFIPLHMFTYYRSEYHLDDAMFPVASREFHRSLSLPIYSAMSDSDVDDVIDIVGNVVTAGRA